MNHPKMQYTYVGLDSHKETHCTVVLNCFFEKLGEITFKNSPSQFEKFLSELQKFKLEGTTFAFGFEDVSAYGRALAVFLLSKNYTVKHVNASLVASERNSMNVLNKTDSFDAECATRVLISRFDNLPDVDSQDKYWVFSQLVTRRRSLVKNNTALKNHLQSFLINHYPSYSSFFKNIDCMSALAFYEKYPSPSRLKGTTLEELESFIKVASNNRQWKGKAEKILNAVKDDGDTTIKYEEVTNYAIVSTINQIRNNLRHLETIDCMLEDFLSNFEFNLKSMRGIDTVMASNLIAEIGNINRFPSPEKLAKYAGIAPVTYSSGKKDVQFSNERGNRTLNTIFYRLAVTVSTVSGKNKKIINPIFYEYYHKKISEGKTKRQALKCVQRRLVNIIWGMMKYNRDYINPPTMDFPKEEQKS